MSYIAKIRAAARVWWRDVPRRVKVADIWIVSVTLLSVGMLVLNIAYGANRVIWGETIVMVGLVACTGLYRHSLHESIREEQRWREARSGLNAAEDRCYDAANRFDEARARYELLAALPQQNPEST